MSAGSWIAHRAESARARVRLFCYPHSGGGASAFSAWRRALPETVELCPIEPPGRWSRRHEPPLRRVEALADGLLPQLGGMLDRPCVLLGHSLGGLVMFEVARRLEAQQGALPAHLVVAASGAPPRSPPASALHDRSDDELLDRLAALYGAERLAAMADPEVRELFLAPLRADLEALATYTDPGGEALSIPLSAFGGRSDPAHCDERLAAWEGMTRGPFESAVLDGDHFFIHDRGGAFFDHLIPILEAAAAG